MDQKQSRNMNHSLLKLWVQEQARNGCPEFNPSGAKGTKITPNEMKGTRAVTYASSVNPSYLNENNVLP